MSASEYEAQMATPQLSIDVAFHSWRLPDPDVASLPYRGCLDDDHEFMIS